ncbi:hypothetical protein ACJIZ3_014566 [Penstemon smallii]|uniref:Uncharacterized protein n=1 Tax=Penstemon smallii TaxID=265156 RepID=A0ABD3RK98_9LAMI
MVEMIFLEIYCRRFIIQSVRMKFAWFQIKVKHHRLLSLILDPTLILTCLLFCLVLLLLLYLLCLIMRSRKKSYSPALTDSWPLLNSQPRII